MLKEFLFVEGYFSGSHVEDSNSSEGYEPLIVEKRVKEKKKYF